MGSWGWGSKQTTTSTNTGTNSATTTPNLNPLAQQFYQNELFPQAHNLIAEANRPVYGDAQKADVLNNLNDLANASTAHLKSSLAGRGALGAGDFTSGINGIEQQRYGNLSQFYSQLPALEQQAHQQNMMQALGFGAGLAGQLPVGQTTVGDQSSTGSQTQTSSPGWGSIVGSMLGGATSMLTGGLMSGLGNSVSGNGSFSSGFGQGIGSYFPQMPPYGGYGAQSINSLGGLGSQGLPLPPQTPSAFGGY